MMGGTIELDSETGQGSTFYFDLTVTCEKGAHREILYDYPALEKISILVADDSRTNRLILSKTFESWKVQNDAVKSGSEVLDILTQSPRKYDLLILDEQMPSMGGVAVAKKIRENRKWDNLKIIILSSLGRIPSRRIESLDISMTITKPVKQSRLLSIILETLRFQDKTASEEENDTPAAPPASKQDLVILLAEDNPDNQRLAIIYLEKAGYRVEVAKNGSEAVAKSESSHYDLILMDIEMPVMDGFEATRVIRQREKKADGEHTTIIALTAHAIQGYREKCLEQGMDDYITKPIKKKVLIETIDRWIDTRHRVLVVDDSVDNRKLIENYLKKEADLKVDFAINGLKAVEKVQRQRYAVILMDMEMPVMDGYTATEKICALLNRRPVPIVALTAHHGSEAVKKCLDSGCTAHLPKPIRKKALIETIRKYINPILVAEDGGQDDP
jgi:CheY-like chemotaxis protein